DGRRFFNPSPPVPRSFSAVPRLLLERRTPWPPSVHVETVSPPPLDDAAAVCTFVGHATFLIQTPAAVLLTDPMFSDRAGPFNLLGPRRARRPAIRFDDLPRIDVILLSHNHYDHCDRATLRRLARRFDPIVVTPIGNGALRIVATRAHHFSARTPFDRNRALWGGFVVDAPHARIYFAGDTAYAPFF